MGTRLRIAVAFTLVALAGLVASLASRPPHSTAATGRATCGYERWTLKTLGDRPTLLDERATTIKYLVTQPAPDSLPGTRLPFERHIYRVTAAVTLVRPEDDGDFHLVLQDSQGRTMIAESPLGSCDRSATAKRQQQMAAARARVRLCSSASVTGVAFFDFYQGQTGVAPTAIELHPILAFRCLTGTVVNGSTPTTPTKPPSATRTGKVKLLSLTSPVSAGSDATLVVSVPTGTSCSSPSPTNPAPPRRPGSTHNAPAPAGSTGPGWSARGRRPAAGRSTSPAASPARCTPRSSSRRGSGIRRATTPSFHT